MLKTRVITAIFLLIGFVSVLFVFPGWIAAFAFAAVAALAAWEWGGLLRASAASRIAYACAVLAMTELLSFAHLLDAALPVLSGLSVGFWLFVVPFWLKRRWTLSANLIGYAIGLVVILPTWLALISLYQLNPLLLLAAMALAWVADSAAYFTGRKFGKNKLAPTISPGKTREGAVGAVAAVLLYGFILVSRYWPETSVLRLVGIGLVLLLLTVLSIIGDLFESLLKRQADIKDSSNLLPGHGGVLDRIDSQTSTLPLVALYFYWIAL